jgi:hypothetical protein
MFPTPTTLHELLGSRLMHPVEKLCNSDGNPRMTGTIYRRIDDLAADDCLYPVTPRNLGFLSAKTVTSTATISIQGNGRFRAQTGVQSEYGAGPCHPERVFRMRYPVAAVLGSVYLGNVEDLTTSTVDSSAHPLYRFSTGVATDEVAKPNPRPDANAGRYRLTF